jgi:hypothetical protein
VKFAYSAQILGIHGLRLRGHTAGRMPLNLSCFAQGFGAIDAE